MGRLPLRGRLPRYRRVDDTSVMFAAICFQAIRSCNGRDWTGLFLKLDRGEVRRREGNGTGNGSLIVRGRWEVVWFGMLTVGPATGRGEKCGRGTSSCGLSFGFQGWLAGWVRGFGFGFGLFRHSGQARDAQRKQAEQRVAAEQALPPPVGPYG